MKMTSKVLAVLMALCMVVVLAACSAPAGASASAPAGSTPAADGGAVGSNDLVAKALSNMQAAEGMSYNMTMNMDMSAAGQQMSMTMDGTISMIEEPMQMSMVMDINAAGESMLMEMYAEQEGDTVNLYVKAGDEWTQQSVTLEDVMSQANADAAENYLENLENVEILGDDAIAGVDCVKASGVVTGAAAQEAMAQGGGLDQFAQMGIDMSALLGDMNVPVTLWISKDGNDLMRMEMDMTETMSNMMDTIFAAVPSSELQGVDLDFSVSNYTLAMEYTAFEGISIPVPDGIAA